jgi:enolase-phosphatase E1
VALQVDAVVVDIEGTTSSTGFVVDSLYPYSRARFGRWLTDLADHPEVIRARAQVEQLVGRGALTDTEVVAALEGWLAADEKVIPLKTLQGLILSDGYRRGELRTHFYPDVVPALRRWHDAGLALYVFSSGSLAAQRSWFAHSFHGDLLGLFRGHFDPANAGPKRQAPSYLVIGNAIGVAAARTVFLSDVAAELDAAREAGWHTVGVRRAGEPHYAAGVGDHPEVASFEQLVIEPTLP